ncbi:hypothetical protein E0Z10_g7391 [Xylaria hypoxylon]|uniref:Delta(24)-sterol reductase n=1 Tax=Xylaria hypoxylon TaxID=37992 RepID=A0A4Z0YY94_9PEZI|nr:hypothetical protein E0Z10_g7391 [Xylaria hypoxylon]
MERHRQAVRLIAATVRGYFEQSIPFRIMHGSTNSTRPAHLKSQARFVDIGALKNVLEVDTSRRVALVEPNVPMDRLVESTLRHGLVPPVVMEFPGITAGGGFAGTAGESSSFKHGYFDQSVNAVEILLPDGEVVVAKPGNRRSGVRSESAGANRAELVNTKLGEGEDPEKYADLFHGAAGAVGTLGITTLLELQLIEAKRFVRTTYRRTTTTAEAIRAVREECRKPGNDYVDGILFSEGHGVIVSGEMTDELPAGEKVRTFSNPWDPWFYMHVRNITKGLPSFTSTATPSTSNTASQGTVTEYIPLAEYLFRYDRGGFWVGEAAFDYFRPVPFTRFFRWFLDDFLHTRMLYRALHASGESARFFVQDLGIPYDTAEEFITHTTKSLDIWPLWLCPLKTPKGPSFHPHVRNSSSAGGVAGSDTEMLNIGVWGWGPKDKADFVRVNRALEAKVNELGGMKWLYAHTYYSEPEFWDAFGGRAAYEALRTKYRATSLPSVYDKVKVRDDEAANQGWKPLVKSLWPVGGLYGIWKGIQSKDYMLHRHSTWRWRSGSEKEKTA